MIRQPSLPQTILITGAGGGIGAALAEAYARPGATLILHGRRAVTLDPVAAHCRQLGSRVITVVQDLRDHEAWEEWLATLQTDETLDLVVVNAGVNTNIGPHGAGECREKRQEVMDVNCLAAMTTIHAVLPAMRQRGQGQIAIISSLAAYFGLPVTPTYCASKAAIKAYGESLRGWLADEGIRVSVVMPGYVESTMCHDMPGPKPFLWTPQRAARVIQRGLLANKARITFPFPLNLGTWFLTVMPPDLSHWFLRRLGYHG